MENFVSEHAALFGLCLSLFAGLATGIGSCIAFFSKRTDTKFLTASLGFSGGVMIYISFMELLSSAMSDMIGRFGDVKGNIYTLLAFFGGIAVAVIIDKLVPCEENPHEVRKVEEMNASGVKPERLMRSGMLFALAIGIHNFPEGIATFGAALAEPVAGIAIAVAVAIHNIPEGITVSVPIYYATGDRKKAFWWSFASGLAEPIGAFLAWLILMPFLSPVLLAVVFAAVAGIMVFISFDELLPLAEQYGHHHLSIYGLLAGMLVMALTLIFC